MTAISEFKQVLYEAGKRNMKVQTMWATAVAVDAEGKTMTAIGVKDELEYYGVSLGLSVIQVPKVGSRCLLGTIDQNEANTYLIHANEVEEYSITSGESMVTVKEEGTVISRGNESLVDVHNDLIDKLGELCDAVNAIVVTNGVGPNIPVIADIKNNLEGLLKARLNDILK